MTTNWKNQLPMWATYFRMFAGLLILPCFYLLDLVSAGWLAAVVFILASITDWLDGYWARKFKAESIMGQLMDPIADKILVTAALIILLYLDRIGPFLVFFLFARDFFVGGLRSAAAAHQVIIAALPIGKWKTVLQMIGVPCLFIYTGPFNLPLGMLGVALLWTSLVLSLLSGFQYWYKFTKIRR